MDLALVAPTMAEDLAAGEQPPWADPYILGQL